MTLQIAGILLANSIGWGFLLAPYVAKGLLRARVSTEHFNLLPRLLYYGIVVALTPYAARILIGSAPSEARPSLWASLGVSIVIGGLLFGGVFISR